MTKATKMSNKATKIWKKAKIISNKATKMSNKATKIWKKPQTCEIKPKKYEKSHKNVK